MWRLAEAGKGKTIEDAKPAITQKAEKGAVMAKQKQPESAVQRSIIQHLRLRGRPGLVFFAVPNGGKRNAREAANLKRQGVVPGVADIILLHNARFYALELKADSGRLSEYQHEFLASVNSAGGFACAARGVDEALRILTAWDVIR